MPPAPTPAAPLPTPDAYTPRHLAERILTSKSAVEGERKQVTVPFADLKRSIARVLAQLGEVSEALNRLREGEELLERQAARGVALCSGRDCHAPGRADEARAELSSAVEMLRAMGMTFWLPGADAELAQIG